MEYRSYILLQEFEQALIQQGFDNVNVSLEHTDQDMVPFRELFSVWSDRFKKAIVADLQQALDQALLEVEVLEQSFVPIDDHAQGATYIYSKVACKRNEVAFRLRVRYVVFHGRVLVLLDRNYRELDEIKDKALKRKLSKLDDKHRESYEQSVELAQL